MENDFPYEKRSITVCGLSDEIAQLSHVIQINAFITVVSAKLGHRCCVTTAHWSLIGFHRLMGVRTLS